MASSCLVLLQQLTHQHHRQQELRQELLARKDALVLVCTVVVLNSRTLELAFLRTCTLVLLPLLLPLLLTRTSQCFGLLFRFCMLLFWSVLVLCRVVLVG